MLTMLTFFSVVKINFLKEIAVENQKPEAAVAPFSLDMGSNGDDALEALMNVYDNCNYYKIGTAWGLSLLGRSVAEKQCDYEGKTIEIINDITDYNFVPIGYKVSWASDGSMKEIVPTNVAFKGAFEGTRKRLILKTETKKLSGKSGVDGFALGMFARISNAYIFNLKLDYTLHITDFENASSVASEYFSIGAIAGHALNSRIEYCYVEKFDLSISNQKGSPQAISTEHQSNIGGVAGLFQSGPNDDKFISNCYVSNFSVYYYYDKLDSNVHGDVKTSLVAIHGIAGLGIISNGDEYIENRIPSVIAPEIIRCAINNGNALFDNDKFIRFDNWNLKYCYGSVIYQDEHTYEISATKKEVSNNYSNAGGGTGFYIDVFDPTDGWYLPVSGGFNWGRPYLKWYDLTRVNYHFGVDESKGNGNVELINNWHHDMAVARYKLKANESMMQVAAWPGENIPQVNTKAQQQNIQGVILSARPDPGYKFVGWVTGQWKDVNGLVFHTFSAQFEKETYNLCIEIYDVNDSLIDNTLKTTVQYGDRVIASYNGDQIIISGGANNLDYTLTESIYALNTDRTKDLTISDNGDQAVITFKIYLKLKTYGLDVG